jgi:hypothetical protein
MEDTPEDTPHSKVDKKPIKDSGERQNFETGAQRDIEKGKPRPGLIHPYFLYRMGLHLAKGAEKYEARNWEKGIPMSRFWDSMMRHLNEYAMGQHDEDHLAAAAFNLMGLIVMPWMIMNGHIKSPNIMDLPDYFMSEKENGNDSPSTT